MDGLFAEPRDQYRDRCAAMLCVARERQHPVKPPLFPLALDPDDTRPDMTTLDLPPA